METILDRIVATKLKEIAEARSRVSHAELGRRLVGAPPARDFRGALLKATGMAIIAEVKKASPSAGVLREDFDPVAIARSYEKAGADCLSVLTDKPFFQGDLDYLRAIRAAVNVPLLRKDFILDDYQVLEARVAGADAVLLIAEILEQPQLTMLLSAIHSLGMQALVELYDPAHLPRILATDAQLIGVNNRDLRTFITSLDHTTHLAPQIPADRCLISESGIRTAEDIVRLRNAGARGVLVGETLMRAPDVGVKLRELRGAGQ